MNPTVLVSGGSGFIGAALVNQLVRGGANVRVLDNNSRGSVRRLAGIEDEIEFVTAPSAVLTGSTPRRCADISKLASLGYRPAVPLSEGIAETVRWY